MKRLFSILFLFVIGFQSLSTLFIIGSFYANRTYISENICVNRFDAVQLCKGKCFLEKQLKAKEQQQEKLPDLKQKQINLFCQNSFEAIFNKKQFIELDFSFESKEDQFSTTYLSSIFRPPRIA